MNEFLCLLTVLTLSPKLVIHFVPSISFQIWWRWGGLMVALLTILRTGLDIWMPIPWLGIPFVINSVGEQDMNGAKTIGPPGTAFCKILILFFWAFVVPKPRSNLKSVLIRHISCKFYNILWPWYLIKFMLTLNIVYFQAPILTFSNRKDDCSSVCAYLLSDSFIYLFIFVNLIFYLLLFFLSHHVSHASLFRNTFGKLDNALLSLLHMNFLFFLQLIMRAGDTSRLKERTM